jgi:hypothetical protein
VSVASEPPQPWWEPPAWLDEADRWIREHLARRGEVLAAPIQPVKNWSISSIRRVPVDGGDL